MQQPIEIKIGTNHFRFQTYSLQTAMEVLMTMFQATKEQMYELSDRYTKFILKESIRELFSMDFGTDKSSTVTFERKEV